MTNDSLRSDMNDSQEDAHSSEGTNSARIRKLERWRTGLGWGLSLASTGILFTWSIPYLVIAMAIVVAALLVPFVRLDIKIRGLGGEDYFGRRNNSGGGRG